MAGGYLTFGSASQGLILNSYATGDPATFQASARETTRLLRELESVQPLSLANKWAFEVVFGGVLRSVEEPDEAPRANFDTFVLGFASVFQVATRENWTSLLFDAMSSVSPVGAVVFYISLVLLTNYILVALFMGTLLQNFQKHFADVKGADVGLPSIISSTVWPRNALSLSGRLIVIVATPSFVSYRMSS